MCIISSSAGKSHVIANMLVYLRVPKDELWYCRHCDGVDDGAQCLCYHGWWAAFSSMMDLGSVRLLLLAKHVNLQRYFWQQKISK